MLPDKSIMDLVEIPCRYDIVSITSRDFYS